MESSISIEFNIPVKGKKYWCISCGCKVGNKSKSHLKKGNSVGMEKAVKFWLTNQLVVHYSDHKLCNNCFNMEDPRVESTLSSNSFELKTLLDLLTASVKKSKTKEETIEVEVEVEKKEPLLDIARMSEEDCLECCGLSKENLENLSQKSGCSIQVVFEFFSKCRHKFSDRLAAVLFQKDKGTVSHNFGRVLENLTHGFVPEYLGSTAFSREQIMEENTPKMFKELLPNVRGAVDGTYFYVEKNTVFDVQRKTYSSHKGRNLLKEMGIILPNGKFFDFIGPFFGDGDHNDEWIWKYITENNCGDVTEVFNLEDDEFLADRGFLRVKEGDGLFKLKTPVGLSPNQKQLSTEDANESRLVTRFRNIVERAFGRLKERWKIIGDVVSSGLWPKIHNLIQLLAAVENAFSLPLWSDKESDKSDIEMINHRKNTENELEQLFQKNEKQWKKQTFEDVWNATPALTLQDIRKWSIGPYALTLAKPYLEHSAELKFWKHKKEKNVFKIKGMVSRFVSSDSSQPRKYTILVKIPKNAGPKDIVAYCTCKAGTRTLGGCAHSCAVIYYLTVNQESDEERPNTARKRVDSTDIIDLRVYKQQKKELAESQSEMQELGSDLQSD
jgi:hypothetical protein